MCLRTRLDELHFSRQVGTFICCTRAPDHTEHRPGLGNNRSRSRSYVSAGAWRGATLNKQSTGLRRHCPGLSLVSMTWYWPLIGWCELTPSVTRRRRQKYEEQSSLWRNSCEDFFLGKYFKRRSRQSVSLNDIILWILMSGMNVWSWIYELFLRNRFPCWCFYNFFYANIFYLQ